MKCGFFLNCYNAKISLLLFLNSILKFLQPNNLNETYICVFSMIVNWKLLLFLLKILIYSCNVKYFIVIIKDNQANAGL